MKKILCVLAVGLLWSNPIFAADHGDSPSVLDPDPTGDIGDLYAWMSSGGDDIVLVMTINAANFSDATQYVFHVGSGLIPLAGSDETTMVLCEFDASQNATCWLGEAGTEPDGYVSGDASDGANPLVSDGGELTVFAGTRDDPFFFNAEGFGAVVEAALAAVGAGAVTFDSNGCPDLTDVTGFGDITTGLVTQLSQADDGDSDPLTFGSGGTATNSFAAGAVSTLVVQVPKSFVTGGGTYLNVWASTRSK